jgi:uncharacterized repeat protein (TIGR04052 family)
MATQTAKLIVGLLALAATPGALAQQSYEIRFRAQVGEQVLACGERYANLGASRSSATLADFRFFVSAVQLVRADGTGVLLALEQDGVWQYKDLALLDFEDGSGSCKTGTTGVRSLVRGTAPKGDYRGLRFTLGVPPELNHADPTIAPSPLNLTAMFWSWQAGYKFLKLDLAPTGGALPSPSMRATEETRAVGFSFHVGSTGCMGGSRAGEPPKCAQSNRVAVELRDFDPAASVVVVDIAALLAETELDKNAPKTSPGCMSFPNDADCNGVMPRLGLPYDGRPARAQVLFSTRAKP